ncbi:putative phage related protein (plasmid) [Selenomonas ruminantium subsp. lactilytica TAM6421]|uniref:Putative phage related protein n=1 Tax=Selenomonas ruminantium subsp. lactilytica (strain NBRC 103574 / TAM6421) TaxID=927704 RepID=I0GVD6_SELRL|nr:DUF3310 domain-containing protein [Selenomonas ruminantium]BAL84723.1 putative phage related protein [Selenomonas ruminantium subsp. lactilytica TAM6421]
MKKRFENGNTYASKLYQLLTSSSKTIRVYSVKTLRMLLGVPAGSYQTGSVQLLLKSIVYEPVETINQKTALKVCYESIKVKGEVVAVKFTVKYPTAKAEQPRQMEFSAAPNSHIVPTVDEKGKMCFATVSENPIINKTTTKEEVPKFLAIEGKPLTIDDAVSHPSHYTDGRIEVIEFIQDKKLDFCRGNIVKYVSRAGKKGDKSKELEDLKKARQYCDFAINQLEGRIWNT